MRTAVYSRFSTDRQNESSIADQVRICTEHATRQGWRITEHFEDQGISGTALGNRPGVLRMREAALARRFDVLLVTDLSRLARSEDLPPLIQRLKFNGVRVIGVQDGFDSQARTARMQAGMAGIMGAEFIAMVSARTYSALETRARAGRPTGGKCYGYRDGAVDTVEAGVVREIFERFADGESYLSIAAGLNRHGVASPGSSWKRSQRRAAGWMGSTVRVIAHSERYRGVVHWNTTEWVKNPDSGMRKPRARPRSEWITHTDERLRIVSDELWQRAAARIKAISARGRWSTAPKGAPKYLLSGLLRCKVCESHYVMSSATGYSCSGYVNGRTCSNAARARRDALEYTLLTPVTEGLLLPARVERMAKEMQADYVQQMKALQVRALEAPREVQELTARIERLRERLKHGDPDMTAQDIQAAIERAETQRRELHAGRTVNGGADPSVAMLTILPRAAELLRKQIGKGLDGDPLEALKARSTLRELFCGQIDLSPDAGGDVWAEYGLQPAVLLQAVGNRGSGGRI
jgi:DNA invertase Pin-like site-specific DNA recombinase